jgi:YjbE family integral membrane protein
MGFEGTVQFVDLTLAVLFLDLLLSGDNAVSIALACRNLPALQRRRAMMAGTGLAILLRFGLTLVASALLEVPLLRLAGGIALGLIALKLGVEPADAESPTSDGPAQASRAASDFGSAIGIIVVADLVMSLDNVVALAAVAQDNGWALALGLLASVPLLMVGSWWVASLLGRYPALVTWGAALLGWLAGDIAISDPMYADWVGQQSPALRVLLPLACAVYVVLQGRIMSRGRAAALALRPPPVPRRARRAAPPAPPREAPDTAPSSVLPTAVAPAAPDVPGAANVANVANVANAANVADVTGVTGVTDSAHVAARTPDPPPSPHGAAAPAPAAIPAPATKHTPPPTAAPTPAPRTTSPARPPTGRVQRWLAPGAAGLLLATGGYVLISASGLPTPRVLTRYQCGLHGVEVYYKYGGDTLRVVAGSRSAEGLIQPDQRIAWPDIADATRTLGMAPPTRVEFADARSVVINGGAFDHITCR